MEDTYTLLNKRLTLSGPRAPEDALWLAASVSPNPGTKVLDAMCGNGVVGLALMARCPGLLVEGVEADPVLATTAHANAQRNSQPGYTAHATKLEAFTTPHLFNLALMNPPFHATTRGHSTPNAAKALAHSLPPNHLTLWLQALYRLLTPTGTMALLLHSACQPELLAFAQNNPCATTLTPLQTAPQKPAKRLLALLTKAATCTLTEHPPLQTHNPTLRQNVLEKGEGLAALSQPVR